ncbi:Cap [Chicken proventriculitis-associated circular virus 1]|nr:Cap [Chicken proventriculitis-associated circular virus 1]
MPYVRRPAKSTRKKPMSRPYRKRTVKRRAPVRKGANYLDTTISVMNPGKDKIVRISKSLPLNVPYAIGGATKGMNVQCGASAITWGQVLVFDPSGTQGNFCGTVTAAGSLLGTSALAEWSAYSLLYQQYKVKKIHLRFNCGAAVGTNLDNNPLTMYIRYQKEWISNPGTANQVTPGLFAEQRNVVKKTFTSQHPDFTYSFYPKVARLSDAGGTGASADSRILKSMDFTSVNTPVDLWGAQIFLQWPAGSGSALLQMDVQYDLEFKTQS